MKLLIASCLLARKIYFMITAYLQISYQRNNINITLTEITQYKKYHIIAHDSFVFLRYSSLQLHLKPSLIIKTFK